jgi:hypothetical protein
MTEYGRRLERLRRIRFWSRVPYVVTLGIWHIVRVGLTQATIGFAVIAGVLGVCFSLAYAAAWWRSRAETRRRAAGAHPSWPAILPVGVARQSGITLNGRYFRNDVKPLAGRLVYLGDVLRWDPSRGLRKRGVGPITWDRSWGAEIVLLRGIESRGCLTLTNGDGTAFDLWLRNARDLRKVLGLVQ